jgi:hypothetical protein
VMRLITSSSFWPPASASSDASICMDVPSIFFSLEERFLRISRRSRLLMTAAI